MYRSSLGPRRVLTGPPTELTMPKVARGPSPRPGLATAREIWPTLASPPAGVAASTPSPSTRSTARSEEWSLPTNRAASVRPSAVSTERSSSRSSTCPAVSTRSSA